MANDTLMNSRALGQLYANTRGLGVHLGCWAIDSQYTCGLGCGDTPKGH